MFIKPIICIIIALAQFSLFAYEPFHERDLGRVFTYHKNKLNYLYIPKNGSSFTRYIFDETFTNEYTDTLATDIKKNYRKLLIVRDPYSRAISSYLEVIKARFDGSEKTLSYPFYLNRHDVCNSFLEFLLTIENNFYDYHTQPQHLFFEGTGFSLDEVDFIVDFAHLEEDLTLFSQQFNIPVNLENKDANRGDISTKTILCKYVETDPVARGLIERIFSADFDFYHRALQRREEILSNERSPL